MSQNKITIEKVTCVNVSGGNQPSCNSVNVPIISIIGPVTVKIPVTLAQLALQVNMDTVIILPEPALEIKEIKKSLKITQCLLVRCGGIQLPSVLFIKGFVRKNIAYATGECSNAAGVCGDIRHCTVDVPFSCTANVTFNGAIPTPIQFNSSAEFSFFRKQKLRGRGFAEKDRLLSSDLSEYNQVSQEYFNELPYCEPITSRIVEYNEFINRKPLHNVIYPFEEKVFQQIEEKMVVVINLKVLQNQQVDLLALCFVTAATTNKPDQQEILSVFKAFRDQVLMTSKKGMNIISLYTELNKQLVPAIYSEPSLGEAIYNDIVKLLPIFDGFKGAAMSSQSNPHIVNDQDIGNAVHLWGVISARLPEAAEKKLEQLFQELNLSSLEGKDISQLL